LGKWLLSGSDELAAVIHQASLYNSWFSENNIRNAINNIALQYLDAEKLNNWLSTYNINYEAVQPKTVGIVAAGNLPLVAFHDILCVLMSGHRVQLKLSEKDNILLPFIFEKWTDFLPELQQKIEIVEKLNHFDAVIATGSNNTARYFEYYFGKYRHIIRKNKNSVAILDGSETAEQLQALAHDVLDYFGLGCRNVSKIYIPKSYDFSEFITNFKQFSYVEQHTPYMNNLDYQRTIYLMNGTAMQDINFINIVENQAYASPISCLHYEYYDDVESVIHQLKADENQIQCIVSKQHIPFGKTQQPTLSDYADGIDTMAFLNGL
jgi:hypothetical protein